MTFLITWQSGDPDKWGPNNHEYQLATTERVAGEIADKVRRELAKTQDFEPASWEEVFSLHWVADQAEVWIVELDDPADSRPELVTVEGPYREPGLGCVNGHRIGDEEGGYRDAWKYEELVISTRAITINDNGTVIVGGDSEEFFEDAKDSHLECGKCGAEYELPDNFDWGL